MSEIVCPCCGRAVSHGAPAASRRSCSCCGQPVGRRPIRGSAARPPTIPDDPTGGDPHDRPRAARSAGTARRADGTNALPSVGCLVLAVTVFVLGVGLLLVASENRWLLPDEGQEPRLSAGVTSDLAVPVPGTDGAYIVEASAPGVLLRIDLDGDGPEWASDPLEDPGSGRHVAFDADRLFVSDGRRIVYAAVLLADDDGDLLVKVADRLLLVDAGTGEVTTARS